MTERIDTSQGNLPIPANPPDGMLTRRDTLRLTLGGFLRPNLRTIQALFTAFNRVSPLVEQQVLIEAPDQTSEGLSLKDRALHDFSTAIRMIEELNPSRGKDDASLKVSQELARVGRLPILPIDQYLNAAQQRENWANGEIYDGISLLQAEMGDISGALQTARKTFEHPWFHISLARTVARHGADPRPIFDILHNKLRADAGSTGDPRQAGYALEAQRELGLDAPKSLLDRFRVRDRKDDDYSNSWNLELVEAYARAGFPQDALDVWRITRDTGHHHRAQALSLIAVSQGRNGIDPRETAADAIRSTEAIKGDERSGYAWIQAEHYANLSRAYAIFQLDPQPLIDLALGKAAAEPTSLRTESYKEIAKAQISFKANAKQTLKLALEQADNIVKPGEEETSGYGGQIQIIYWEDIFQLQLEGGYFDEAHETLDRMDRYKEEYMAGEKAVRLAELARAQMLSIR